MEVRRVWVRASRASVRTPHAIAPAVITNSATQTDSFAFTNEPLSPQRHGVPREELRGRLSKKTASVVSVSLW
jgi:hypothetical protein